MSEPKSAGRNGGCSYPIGNNQVCGQTQTLGIIKEFRKLYEGELHQIESRGDHKDSLQAKAELQQNWIRDLTEQNEMLVRVVEELEMEATDRVAMLEEKLRNSAQQGSEMTQKLEEKERLLRQSQEILDRIPMDAEALAVRLKEKDQELNTLRRSMLDMRNALTIEVAEKHDVILNLRRDVQQLEEKYRQANKQTQFKDDIIKELRKEIKQLKGQISVEASADDEELRIRIKELEEENRILKNQIFGAKGEVMLLHGKASEMAGYLAVTTQERRQSAAVIEALQKENILNLPKDATQLMDVLEKERQIREVERTKHNEEISNLRQKNLELENALKNSQVRGENLQKTVDLYQNSVNILEVSEQQSIIEISQLRQTILNLQEALVTSKHQLDELQQKVSTEVSSGWASRWFGSSSGTSKTAPANNNNKSVHDV